MNITNFHFFKGDFNTLKKTISDNKGLNVVEFSEKWDPSCQRFSTRLKNVAALNPEVTFLSIDIEENAEITNHYPISSVPHLKFIVSDGKNGFTEVDQAIGRNSNLIQQKIESIKKSFSA